MSDSISLLLLLSVPGLPLLLALPALRFRLKHPLYLALVPAIVLLGMPMPVSADLPWLLLGAQLGLDAGSRWLLAGQVLVWAAAVKSLQPDSGNAEPIHWQSTFFLLTMGGSLGVVLAMDPVGFLVAATVAGYGFYALLAGTGNGVARRGGRGYLVAMILADLALFEAILIVASGDRVPGFASLQQVLVQSDSRELYLAVVLAGFALRAGAWPVHFWLRQVFSSPQPAVAILLPAVPVSLAMFGVLRWLPPGRLPSPVAGWTLQAMGLAAMLHALLQGRRQGSRHPAAARITLFATGLFTVCLGMALAEPDFRYRYSAWLYSAIGLFGPAMALFLLPGHRLRLPHGHQAPPVFADRGDDKADTWFERLASWSVSHWRQAGFATLPRWRAYGTARLDRYRRILPVWQRLLEDGEQYLRHWPLAMTLFLLLAGLLVLSLL